MTSYSTYGTGRLQLVDGALHYDQDIRDEQIEQLADVIAAGAARALLDITHDINDPSGEGDEIAAVQWHSKDEGWELDAIRDEDREPFRAVARAFVLAFTQEILTLGSRIAWDKTSKGDTWHGDDGMGYYRVGMLLGYTGARDGMGFDEYSDARYGTETEDRMRMWVDEQNLIYWEQSWIDATEEPRRLHLSA